MSYIAIGSLIHSLFLFALLTLTLWRDIADSYVNRGMITLLGVLLTAEAPNNYIHYQTYM